jgi:prepilin-type processing-associated H-X9-DG protein
LLAALLIPAVQSAREAARRMACTNNLKQIGLAMHNYHDAYGAFPAPYVTDAAGKPMHSWRVALLPFLGRQDLYDLYNFNEPWDSPDNLMVERRMPDVYRCPSSTSAKAGSTLTSYVVIVGDPVAPRPQSVFVPNHWTKLSEIIDGSSNTLLVVETANPVSWTCPDTDPTYEKLVAQAEVGPSAIGSEHPGGANVVFADGSAQFLPLSIDLQIIRLMVQPSDGQPLPPR